MTATKGLLLVVAVVVTLLLVTDAQNSDEDVDHHQDDVVRTSARRRLVGRDGSRGRGLDDGAPGSAGLSQSWTVRRRRVSTAGAVNVTDAADGQSSSSMHESPRGGLTADQWRRRERLVGLASVAYILSNLESKLAQIPPPTFSDSSPCL